MNKETKIKPEDWIVEITCPNCHRSRKVQSKVRRSGCTLFNDVILPQVCIFCETERLHKEEEEGQ